MKSDVKLVLTRFSEDVDFKEGVVRNYLYFEHLDGSGKPFRIPVPAETTQVLVAEVFGGQKLAAAAPTEPSAAPASPSNASVRAPRAPASVGGVAAAGDDGLDANGEPIPDHPANAWMKQPRRPAPVEEDPGQGQEFGGDYEQPPGATRQRPQSADEVPGL